MAVAQRASFGRRQEFLNYLKGNAFAGLQRFMRVRQIGLGSSIIIGMSLVAVLAAIYFGSSSAWLARIPTSWLYLAAATFAFLLAIAVVVVARKKPKGQKELEREFDESVEVDRRQLLAHVEKRYKLAGGGEQPLILTGLPDPKRMTELGENQLAYVGTDSKARASHVAIVFVYLRPEMVVAYEAIVDVTSSAYPIWERVLDFPFRSIATVEFRAEATPLRGARQMPQPIVEGSAEAHIPGRGRSREELTIAIVDGSAVRVVARDRSVAASRREGAQLAWAGDLENVWAQVRERWIAARS